MRKTQIDEAVIDAILGGALRPAVIEAVIEGVIEAMAPETMAPALDRMRAELASVEREIARFVEALAVGGDIAVLLTALKVRQDRQGELQRTTAAASHVNPQLDRKGLGRHVRERAASWRSLLTGSVQDGRQWFREILVSPIQFSADQGEKLIDRFSGELAIEGLFTGLLAFLELHPVWRPQRSPVGTRLAHG